MFDKNIRQICINVCNQLSKYNIKGIEKKRFTSDTFNLHIDSLYNWIKKVTTVRNNNKYLNSKIGSVIENYVIDRFDKKFKIYEILKKY